MNHNSDRPSAMQRNLKFLSQPTICLKGITARRILLRNERTRPIINLTDRFFHSESDAKSKWGNKVSVQIVDTLTTQQSTNPTSSETLKNGSDKLIRFWTIARQGATAHCRYS